ncbi:uncharacterized protein M421DRAFT_224446 [Didymella exigua CBS 183.55]|uniref:Uncharacterized protein n=1 Tax=Didymella exigua CBS 183.55 TaxID=1150837 RepID=A0A6A5RKJ1_9PLEO|nr:uncharacterized protein M421DRAFT_224446 [Didymella exigua CBS 183.55]KAF1926077.1 hypothetical protein M421DRAFT_224446 [Didymella exigua CBS 183.55]
MSTEALWMQVLVQDRDYRHRVLPYLQYDLQDHHIHNRHLSSNLPFLAICSTCDAIAVAIAAVLVLQHPRIATSWNFYTTKYELEEMQSFRQSKGDFASGSAVHRVS